VSVNCKTEHKPKNEAEIIIGDKARRRGSRCAIPTLGGSPLSAPFQHFYPYTPSTQRNAITRCRSCAQQYATGASSTTFLRAEASIGLDTWISLIPLLSATGARPARGVLIMLRHHVPGSLFIFISQFGNLELTGIALAIDTDQRRLHRDNTTGMCKMTATSPLSVCSPPPRLCPSSTVDTVANALTRSGAFSPHYP
jgi:hypothetical protein